MKFYTTLVILLSLFIFDAHAKDKIKLKNNVVVKFGYNLDYKQFKLEEERTQAGIWRNEKILIEQHNACITPFINSDNQIISENKKAKKSYKKLRENLSKYPSYYQQIIKKRNARKYFLTARNDFSERARKILELIDSNQQSQTTINELQALRSCYFSYHGALNNLEELTRNYMAESYKEEQRELLFRGAGLSKDAAMVAAMFSTKKKRGSERRKKTPAFFPNIKIRVGLGNEVGPKERTRLQKAYERFSDYVASAQCMNAKYGDKHFISLLEKNNVEEYIFHLKGLLEFVNNNTATDNKKKVVISNHPDIMKSSLYLDKNEKTINRSNKKIYEALIENLSHYAKKNDTPPIICVTELMSSKGVAI